MTRPPNTGRTHTTTSGAMMSASAVVDQGPSRAFRNGCRQVRAQATNAGDLRRKPDLGSPESWSAGIAERSRPCPSRPHEAAATPATLMMSIGQP